MVGPDIIFSLRFFAEKFLTIKMAWLLKVRGRRTVQTNQGTKTYQVPINFRSKSMNANFPDNLFTYDKNSQTTYLRPKKIGPSVFTYAYKKFSPKTYT